MIRSNPDHQPVVSPAERARLASAMPPDRFLQWTPDQAEYPQERVAAGSTQTQVDRRAKGLKTQGPLQGPSTTRPGRPPAGQYPIRGSLCPGKNLGQIHPRPHPFPSPAPLRHGAQGNPATGYLLGLPIETPKGSAGPFSHLLYTRISVFSEPTPLPTRLYRKSIPVVS